MADLVPRDAPGHQGAVGQPGGGVHRRRPLGLGVDVELVGVGEQRELQPLEPSEDLVQLQDGFSGLAGAQAPERDTVETTGGGVADRGQQGAGEAVHPLRAALDRGEVTPPALTRNSPRAGRRCERLRGHGTTLRVGVRVLLHDSTMPGRTDSLSPGTTPPDISFERILSCGQNPVRISPLTEGTASSGSRPPRALPPRRHELLTSGPCALQVRWRVSTSRRAGSNASAMAA